MALDANQVTALNKMLMSIGNEGIRFYRDTPYRPWPTLASHHKSITDKAELEALIPSHERVKGDLAGRAIPVRPSRDSNSAAALLRLEWDFEADPWMLKYYLALYYGQAANAQPLLGISFRLEQPEAGGAASVHDYWHIQLCKEVASDRKTKIIAVHEHTPVSYPAFPLNAADAVSLTASLSIALWGRPGLRSLFVALSGQGPLITALSERYDRGVS